MSTASRIEWTETTKACSRCQETKSIEQFARDRSRSDGLTYWCRACRNQRQRQAYTPSDWTPTRGRRYVGARAGDFRQARRRVNYLVQLGVIPPANTQPCADCGHVWRDGERRHEYDHHLGYGAEHHEDVEPVCTTCHHARESQRRAA